MALAEILGVSAAGVCGRLGVPRLQRLVSGEPWLLYEWKKLSVRIRCGAGSKGVTSWTVRFVDGARTLCEATRPLGLWPAAAPDAAAAATPEPMLRRAVLLPGATAPRSLTASLAEGRIKAVTLFDEPPDWR